MFKAIKNQAIYKKVGKMLLLIALVVIFLYQMNQFDWSTAEKVYIHSYFPLLVAIVLVGVNWYFEWKKWVVGMSQISIFPKTTLVKGFYAGMLSGFLTPSALGNFLGRMTAVHPEWRAKVTSNTLMGNGAQFSVSLLMGVLSLFFLGHKNPMSISVAVEFMLIALVVGVIIVYFSIGQARYLQKFFITYFPSVISISTTVRAHFFYLSLVRYLVFSFQFYLVILAFQPAIDGQVIFWIWQLYLWTTLSPSLFLGKLFIRETFAIFILTQGGVELPIALFGSILLWLLNNVIPSLFAFFKWNQNVLVEA